MRNPPNRRTVNVANLVSVCRRALLAAALLPAASAIAQQAQPRRLLFIGNSLTYFYDLPSLVQAAFAGIGESIDVAMIAKPNYGLQDHWSDGDAQREIERGRWNVVVLQQGPSSLPDSRRTLLRYVRRFSELIREADAAVALYSVWPMRNRARDFDRAIESYELAAADVGAILFPVAAAWRATPPEIELYDPDGLHPSHYGAYLASLVMFSVLSGRSPADLPRVLEFTDGRRVRVPDAEGAVLQQIAARVTGR